MAQLSIIIGKECTEEFFLTRFLDMCTDPICYVRRACAQYFPIICQVMGNDKTELELVSK